MGRSEYPSGDMSRCRSSLTVVYTPPSANAAALAEVRAGCAKNYNDAVMITLGTGVGSGLIFGKKIFAGCNGSAGEIGHISLFPDGLECNCGRRGCFELYASATALKNQTKKAINNKFIQEAMTDFLRSELQVYFIENKAEADKIAEQVLINKRSRETAERTRVNLKSKKILIW